MDRNSLVGGIKNFLEPTIPDAERRGILLIKNINAAPHQSTVITIPYPKNWKQHAGEITLSISVHQKSNSKWAPAGFTVAEEQFIVQPYPYPYPSLEATDGPEINVKEGRDQIILTLTDYTITLNKSNGALTSYRYQEQRYLKHPLEPYFWKPPNDNQKRNGYANRLGAWKFAAQGRELKDVNINQKDDRVEIIFKFQLPVKEAGYQLSYILNQSGA